MQQHQQQRSSRNSGRLCGGAHLWWRQVRECLLRPLHPGLLLPQVRLLLPRSHRQVLHRLQQLFDALSLRTVRVVSPQPPALSPRIPQRRLIT